MVSYPRFLLSYYRSGVIHYVDPAGKDRLYETVERTTRTEHTSIDAVDLIRMQCCAKTCMCDFSPCTCSYDPWVIRTRQEDLFGGRVSSTSRQVQWNCLWTMFSMQACMVCLNREVRGYMVLGYWLVWRCVLWQVQCWVPIRTGGCRGNTGTGRQERTGWRDWSQWQNKGVKWRLGLSLSVLPYSLLVQRYMVILGRAMRMVWYASVSSNQRSATSSDHWLSFNIAEIACAEDKVELRLDEDEFLFVS